MSSKIDVDVKIDQRQGQKHCGVHWNIDECIHNFKDLWISFVWLCISVFDSNFHIVGVCVTFSQYIVTNISGTLSQFFLTKELLLWKNSRTKAKHFLIVIVDCYSFIVIVDKSRYCLDLSRY